MSPRPRPWHAAKRWMYASGRPNLLARWLNDLSAWQYRHGILTLGGRGVTLETRGRTSGRRIELPLVLVRHDGHRYVVSMLGTSAGWLRNVEADGGRAVLHAPRPQDVRLVEVPPEQRAPILRRYLDLAPGARPHVPVDRHEPLERFEEIAADYPVLRVEPA
ncbi:nitroreductase/quinone reductase family protein [Cellulomonas biazotea]|nr:nitroreductase/quinone reductase family protein [Cellulomonas biazotea]